MQKVGKIIFSVFLLASVILLLLFYFVNTTPTNKSTEDLITPEAQNKYASFPLSIEYQRGLDYRGSNLKIEQTLTNGENYKQYIASYTSGGLKIYGLLAIPNSPPQKSGYPAIIFNHGYIQPEEYRTTEKYVAYFSDLANAGYVVFKPDYRGNGDSEGKATGAYYSTGYTTDVLNALASVKRLDSVDPKRIGMWGHSMGGYLTMQVLVISKDIKAAVIWGGVVGSPTDLINNWHPLQTFTPSARELASGRTSKQSLITKYGTPEKNPDFWNALSAYSYISDIASPVQLDYGEDDDEVPPAFSLHFYNTLIKNNKTAEIYSYKGSDHNISQEFDLAMQRTIEFFNKYLKK